jgi:hypothetical protein
MTLKLYTYEFRVVLAMCRTRVRVSHNIVSSKRVYHRLRVAPAIHDW